MNRDERGPRTQTAIPAGVRRRTDTSAVPCDLVHHDLITVPFGNREPGIFWLRMYERGADRIAVLTEVPGNPSSSVTNSISSIAHHIEKRFGVSSDHLVLFEIWPRGSVGVDIPNVKRVRPGRAPVWTDSSRAEIEALVGGPLPELPTHEELYRRVLALGGGVMEERRRPVFEPVPVSDLPPPHNPSRCQHIDRFRHIAERTQGSADSSSEAELEAGRAFLGTLTPDDLRACSFHDGDWKAIADESVRIIDVLGRRDPEDYAYAARRSHLRDRDRDWLVSLFAAPIFIGGGSYTNGQHRGCALRFSGGERAAVVTGDESLGEVCTDWEYEGGG